MLSSLDGRCWVNVSAFCALAPPARAASKIRTSKYALCRLSYVCRSSLAGSIGTSLASQSSHLNNASFYYLPASLFPFPLVLRRAFFSHFSVLCLCVCFGTCKHVVVEHLPRAQHSAIRPAQSSKAGTCRSERDNASKQTELARAESKCVFERLYSSAGVDPKSQ